MSDLILHHYDASPFSQKAIKMLAVKGLAWKSALMPMLAPKPDVTRLTGGYHGTPVLQAGADLYVDTVGIAQELERRAPQPSLFPGDAGILALALSPWGDAFFECGLHMAIRDLSPSWDDAFMADRRFVFERLDFSEVQAGYDQACAGLRAHASLTDRALADGRRFLLGPAPGLADLHAWVNLWFTRQAFPHLGERLSAMAHLPGWEARVAALGEGDRSEIEPALAHAEAARMEPEPLQGLDPQDPLGLTLGQAVSVEATGSNRGVTRGALVGLSAEKAVIRPSETGLGAVHVHFPRIGYRISAA